MKRIVAFTLSILLLIAGVALAQNRRGPGGPPPPMMQGAGATALADYLALTADQKAAWETIHEDTRAAMQALHEQQRAKLMALLTPDQQAKFAAFEAAREFMGPRGPHPPR